MFSFLPIYADELILPPELKYWLEEVRKANKSITISDFKLLKTESRDIEKVPFNKSKLYPVFQRWNYSGNRLAYFNFGHSLSKRSDGLYSISFDADSSVLILDANYNLLFQDFFGISSGINSIAWLRDNTLIGVGIEVNYIDRDKSLINLMIIQYVIADDKVNINRYLYTNAFDNEKRVKLKLNWFEQRPDYFYLK